MVNRDKPLNKAKLMLRTGSHKHQTSKGRYIKYFGQFPTVNAQCPHKQFKYMCTAHQMSKIIL